MNNTVRVAAFVIAAAVSAVGLASPAQADDFSGTYSINNSIGESQGTWTVIPCETDTFIPCARVAKTGGETAPWDAEAHLSVGYWSLVVDQPDVISCADGNTFPGRVTYSWDAATLDGVFSFYDNGGVCGGDPQTFAARFQLVRT